VPVIDHLVNYLVNQHEVLPNTLFVDYPTVVPEHLDHSVHNLHYERGRAVILGGDHEIDAELLGEEEVDAVDVLLVRKPYEEWWWVLSLRGLDLSEEDLGGVSAAQVLSN